jgi:hypothetical protein
LTGYALITEIGFFILILATIVYNNIRERSIMPRPKLDLETSKKIYFLDKGVTILNVECKGTPAVFNACSFFTIQCKKNSKHTYKLNISSINTKNIDVTICPHCLRDAEYNKDRLPLSFFQNYAIKNSLMIENPKEFYSRWHDSITFSCSKCQNRSEIKALFHFEKITYNQEYQCSTCIQINKGLISNEELSNSLNHMITIPVEMQVNLIPTTLNKHPTAEYLAKLKETTYHLVEFNGSKQKAIFQCKKCGNLKETNAHNILHASSGCNNCFLIAQKHNVNNKLIQICKDSNIFPLNQYVDIETPIKFKCNNCGINFEKSWAKINGARYVLNCPECHKRVNKAQNSVAQYIQELLGYAPEQNNKILIKPLELDIVINNTIAIEYCGAVWHSTKYKENTNYHQEKLDACTDKGIRLITIFDDEWKNKEDICKSRIRNLLGLTLNKIHARKCLIKKISNEEALSFCAANHIQGKGQANKSYGLFYNDKLVSVMTFSLPSASKSGKKKDYDWELNRFCSALDTVVIGGANKLLSAFRIDYPKDKIITFCDLRWGSGGVYEKMGFKFLYRTKPNYYYIGEHTKWERKHRFGFTKKKLIELFKETDVNLTEREIANKNGLFQIHDCGHLKFILE